MYQVLLFKLRCRLCKGSMNIQSALLTIETYDRYGFPNPSSQCSSQLKAAACCRSSSSTDTTFLVTSGELCRCAGVACCRTSSLNHLDKIFPLPTPPGEWLRGGKFITGLETTSNDTRLKVSVFLQASNHTTEKNSDKWYIFGFSTILQAFIVTYPSILKGFL